MADVDVNRADQFDRADFAARPLRMPQSRVQSRSAQPLPVAVYGSSEPYTATPQSPAVASAVGAPTGDAGITADHLRSLGWTQAKIQKILGGPEPEDTPADSAQPKDPTAQAGVYLRSLGWTESDIARLLVGPEKSHLTAESLFRQHAANSPEQQQTLLKALAQAGAQKVKPDPSLLSGLNTAHLSPESPSDLEQLISQFAELPDVQKQRFLLLLGTQKPSTKTTTPKSDLSPKKAGGTEGDRPKTSGSAGNVLPIVKSSLDLLNTALKGILDATKEGSKKSVGDTGKWRPEKNSTADESDTEAPPSPAEDESSDEDEDLTDDEDSTEDMNWPSSAEEQLGDDSEREPD